MPGTPGTGNARRIPINVQKICSLCQAWENNNDCQARENKQRLASAGKQATIAKRGKTRNDCQARENKQRLPSVGKQQRLPSARKQAAISKRGKTSNDCQARENKQRLPSAGKQATIAKRGKTSNVYQARENKPQVWSGGKQSMGSASVKIMPWMLSACCLQKKNSSFVTSHIKANILAKALNSFLLYLQFYLFVCLLCLG